MNDVPLANQLLARWSERLHDDQGFDKASEYVDLARKMLSCGMPLQALEVAEEGQQKWPNDLGLGQIRGMALARSGATTQAAEQLSRVVNVLRQMAQPDRYLLEESMGVLARSEKDLGLQASDATTRKFHLQQSIDLYREAYEKTGGYWTGINVATLCNLVGRTDEAATVNREISQTCRKQLDALKEADDADESVRSSRYWLLATLGEVALNEQNYDRAGDYYQQAVKIAGKRYGDIRATRSHAVYLLDHYGADARLADRWLPLPTVAVLTGHMIDAKDRKSPRFPATYESKVRESIERWIEENDVQVGFASAASGSDILFHEVLQSRGGENYVVLPFAEDAFISTSVATCEGPDWVERFWKVIKGAAGTIRAGREQTETGPLHYRYTNHIILGLARIRASEIGTKLRGLAVWNGEHGDVGGTFDAMASWAKYGVPMDYVALELSSRERFKVEHFGDESSTATSTPIDAPENDSRVMYLLFADVAGFSQLSDREVRLFMSEYLGRVAAILPQFETDVVVRETVGDGLYLAFGSQESAGAFAIELAEMVATTDWQALGFHLQLQLRVALHAGPVILCRDPVTGLLSAVGSHVSRAARLEPKTPPGLVYASEAFAALANLGRAKTYHCRYVKQLEWAKRYGTFPTFLVTRS